MHEAADQPGPSQTAAPRAGLAAWAIGPMFAAVAAWLYFLSPHVEVPRGEMQTVTRDQLKPGARRQPMGDPPQTMIGGYEHGCAECHRLFDSPPVARRTLMQHTDIVLRHGMNDRCFNCHDREDRTRLVLHDGTLIGFGEVPRLCSQCHGTVFRDWQRGTHGKTMGSWDVRSGKQHRLNCNDCHDPHSPAYQPVAPLPGPHTLRMGDQSARPEEEGRHMPLRQRSLPGREHGENPDPTGDHP
jgi:hypothetical protein